MSEDILNRFTSHMRNSIEHAKTVAIKEGAEKITNLHLLYGIFLEPGSVGHNILKDIGFEKVYLENNNNNNLSKSKKELPFSDNLKETFKQATKIAAKYNYPYIGTEHLVYAIMKSSDHQIQEVIRKSLVKTMQNTDFSKLSMNGFDQMPDFAHSIGPNFGVDTKNKETDPLVKYASNLNKEGLNDSHPIIGRNDEVARVINILLRKNKNNPVLVGDPGVGKTAIVEALAQRINKGEVPMQMSEKTIYELDLGLLLSGTTFRGEFERRLKDVISKASNDENAILFIDEIHNLIGTGNAMGSMDAANMLKPALAKGKLKVIGATTFDEYKKFIEKDSALERRFQMIKVDEPTETETKKILMGIRKDFEKHHKVKIDERSISSAISLSKQYITDRFLPDKAIDLIDEAQAEVKATALNYELAKKIKKCFSQKKKIKKLKEKLIMNDEFKVASGLKKDEQKLDKVLNSVNKEMTRRQKMIYLKVNQSDIKKIVSRHTGIPIEEIESSNLENVVKLRKRLKKEVIGQDEAIDAITKTVQRSYSGINDQNRPLGSFIFLGPTGVGKTFLAKNLAEILFKKPTSFVRIDMSELSEKHNVSKLIGAPAGYVGYNEGGKLTDSIKRNPYSLILFDEIEKSHPEVLNILLQILEDGRLTDASNRIVDFTNTVVVITSNIGAQEFIKSSIGFNQEMSADEILDKKDRKKGAVNKLKDTMIPELLNRIDNVLVFNPLNEKNLAFIARKEIKKINDRMKLKRARLKIEPKVIRFIAEQSKDRREGARVLRKKIDDLIKNPIAEIILIKKSNEAIEINAKLKSGKIVFTKKRVRS